MSRTFNTNVTDLHLCNRCPRLLAWQLSGKKNAWLAGSEGGGESRGCGTKFHNRIAGAFHQDAAKKGVKQREILDLFIDNANDPQAMKKALLHRIYRNYLAPFLDENSEAPRDKQLGNTQLVTLGKMIEKWADFLVDFFHGNSGFHADPKAFTEHAFLPPEKNMRADYTAADGAVLTIGGRFDSALFDKTCGEVLLVEYKCRKEADPTEELAQLALYAWLIRPKAGLLPRACVLYLEEKNPRADYSAEIIGDVVNSHLPHLFDAAIQVIRAVNSGEETIPKTLDPHLCKKCPYSKDCENKFGKSTALPVPTAVPTADLSSPPPLQEADDHLHQLVDCLAKHKLPVQPDGYTGGPRFIRLKIVPLAEKGVTVAKIQRLAKDLQIGLQLTHPPLIQTQSGHVSVDVPRKKIKTLLLSELIANGEATHPDSDVAVPLGAEIDGKTYWLNFAEPTMSSVLIGGTSGSGKSILLQSLVLGLRLANPKIRTEFTLIDPKRVTFTKLPLQKCDAELICDLPPALERLSQLVEEMEQRYHLFETEKCSDITAYNAAHAKKPLTHHVTVIDEFADLMLGKKADKEQLERAIQRLGAKGRAAGFHLVLATQRPEVKVISPLIKANLQVKIAMKVTSQANSKIILDEPGAECLIGNGDMLLGGSVALVRLQGALPSKTDFETC